MLWTNIFKENRNVGQVIKLAEVCNIEDTVVLSKEDIDDVETAWGFCLVGYFAADVRDNVLNGGPYFIYGRPLLLKVMPCCFEFGDEGVSSVPVWINLPDLPLDCWNAKALSKIVSKVGKPISRTNSLLRRKNFHMQELCIQLPTRKTRIQNIVFEYAPKFCKSYKIFGHTTKGCKAQPQVVRNNDTVTEVIPSSEAQGPEPNVVPPLGTSVEPTPSMDTLLLKEVFKEIKSKCKKKQPAMVTDSVNTFVEEQFEHDSLVQQNCKARDKVQTTHAQTSPNGRLKGSAPYLPP
ncbi:hypothetical protein ACJIZ3_014368 [Penstemon smallii]|uniref:DUF4283 domain-containing protein n=1 Tax=Penstemon smallii TaxID=265156 RepID=A0ABD3RJK2_9LAMI